MPFKIVTFNDSAAFPLAEGASDSLSIRFSIEYTDLIPGKTVDGLEDVNRGLIANIVSAVFDPEEGSPDSVEDAAAAYEDDLLDMYRSESAGLGESSPGWYDYINAYFTGSRGNYISYVAERESFRGGAHPFNSITAVVLDYTTGDVVTEQDFFVDGYEKELGKLLSERLPDALQNDPEALDALFTKDIAPNGNFEISRSGVTYYYQPYELGPYYLGLIAVDLSWKDLKDLVR